MACVTCTEASDAPQHHRFFAEGCLHCAARRIQFIQRRLNLAPDAIRNRCRTALAQAMALGLPEAQIRAMAKKTEWQLQQPAQDAQPASLPVPRKRGR
jgi:predicted  nucleic acid-binding Zn-ribbon protein